jgi:ferric-dicitrate binding protein FerR (iron transport regulator)
MDNNNEAVYNEIYATDGTRSALKLADGSLVWLNSGSSLKYPDKFIRGDRNVFLKGEAYFEVHSDKSHPFVVQTSTMRVRATGTKFCVSAYANDREAEVTLLHGNVSVTSQTGNKKNEVISEMKPNQHLALDTLSGKIKINIEDGYKYIAWKDGKLIFRNEPFSNVVKKISQLYKVDIELQGNELQDYRYRATFEDESLSEILKLLKLSSPINYKEIKRQRLPDGSFSKRKIIIF